VHRERWVEHWGEIVSSWISPIFSMDYFEFDRNGTDA
jgi:hypothetical protein